MRPTADKETVWVTHKQKHYTDTIETNRELENPDQPRPQHAFTHDAAQNGNGVDANLNHCEIAARMLLNLHHAQGAGIALISHLGELEAARGGQRHFSQREKCAGGNQKNKNEKALKRRHKKEAQFTGRLSNARRCGNYGGANAA